MLKESQVRIQYFLPKSNLYFQTAMNITNINRKKYMASTMIQSSTSNSTSGIMVHNNSMYPDMYTFTSLEIKTLKRSACVSQGIFQNIYTHLPDIFPTLQIYIHLLRNVVCGDYLQSFYKNSPHTA